MGYEHLYGGCVHASVELRRVRNAKTTALRHRKWQDARLEREYEEKRKAEEILNQRRQERARLSSYIYSSPQNGDKRYSNRSQGNKKCISDGNKQPKKMMDGDPNDISEERSISKGNDVCSLSSLAITNKPCDLQTWSQGNKICLDNGNKLSRTMMGDDLEEILEKKIISEGNSVEAPSNVPITDKPCDLQTWNTIRRQDESEGTPDPLEEALQKRLENETATSALIAELTDMKSRLDDCLPKPVDDSSVDISVRALFKNCIDSDHGTKISEHTDDLEVHQWHKSNRNRNDQINAFMFKREESLEDLEDSTDSDHGTKISKQIYEHKEFQWCEPRRNKNDQINAFTFENNEGCYSSNHGISYMNVRNCGSNLSSTVSSDETFDGRYGNTEGDSLVQKRDLTIDERNTSTNSMMIPRSEDASVPGYEGSSCNKENREHKFLHTMLQEPHKQQSICNTSAQSKTEQNAKVITTDCGAELKSIKQKSRPQSLLSCWSKSSKILTSLNLAQACQGSYAKLDALSSQHSRKPIPSCMKNKKRSSKGIGFSDHEESILASIERLDMKLAIVSAKTASSSQTSFISDELQSIKSAPPLMKHKPTMHRIGGSLASKRRQNVGLTNMLKEKTNEFQPCTSQKPRKLQDHSVKGHNERKQTSEGTIILHQNAEFLFS